MVKALQIKYLLFFLAGMYLGILAVPKVQAQSQFTDTSGATHLRAAVNPLDEKVTLKVNPGNKNMKYVKIFDIIGNEVASIDLSGKSGSLTFSLDASHLENGIYLCNLYSDKGIVETRKIYWSR
jgi:hypothetical protein